MATVLVIPDYQAPFNHRHAIEFLKAVKAKYKPDFIVQIGDLSDQHAFGKYIPSTKSVGGREEMLGAVKELKHLYKLFPEVCVCLGNHDLRIAKKAAEVGIDESFLKSYAEIIQAPKGWQFADRWEIEGIIYEHGIGRSGKQGALLAAKANMQSTVIGHLHAHAGILFDANRKHCIWGFNVGALIDDKKYAFDYGRFNAAKSILGCGVIKDGIPQFIPMALKENGDWTRKLSA